MYTPVDNGSCSYRVKGSKFIGFLFPINSIDDFEEMLETIRREHHGATHHCYAYRLNPAEPTEFSQDDGEPGGTAGLPILNQLRSADLVNAAVIVVRYFGGTKLGTSGLIEAYGHTAGLCIEDSAVNRIKLIHKFRITYPYPEESFIQQLKHTWGLIELDSTYMEEVTLLLGCKVEDVDSFSRKLEKETSWRNIEVTSLGQDYVTFPVSSDK